MICPECNKELIRGGDHDFEDFSIDGEGIVSNFSCNDCDIFIEVYKTHKKG